MSDELEKIDPFEGMQEAESKELNKDQVKKIKLKGKLVEQQVNQIIDYIENELFEDRIG